MFFTYEYDTIDLLKQKGGLNLNQGIIVGILSLLFYLTNLLSGGLGQPIEPHNPPQEQQNYQILGQSGSILAQGVTLRVGPSSDTQTLGTLEQGQPVLIIDEQENWYKIRPRQGLEGWVPKYALTIEKVNQKQHAKKVLSLYPGGEKAYEGLLNQGANLTGLSTLGWQLDSYGGIQANFDPEEMGRALYFAGNQELETLAHLTLPPSLNHLLVNPSLQTKAKDNILAVLQEWGLKGVMLDLDYEPGTNEQELFAFLQNLADALQQKELQIVLSIPWNASLDYGKISAAVDYLVLKSPNSKQMLHAGPLASAIDLEDILAKVTAQMDSNKLMVLLPTGGLSWPKSGLPTHLSHQDVLELAASKGANVKWDAETKTPYFQYGSGSEVWFENHYSLKYKFDLVKKYNLAGLALDGLGQEDPEIWPSLQTIL